MMDVARRFPYRRATLDSLLIQAQSAQEVATWQLVLWLTMLVFAWHTYVAGPVVVSARVALPAAVLLLVSFYYDILA